MRFIELVHRHTRTYCWCHISEISTDKLSTLPISGCSRQCCRHGKTRNMWGESASSCEKMVFCHRTEMMMKGQQGLWFLISRILWNIRLHKPYDNDSELLLCSDLHSKTEFQIERDMIHHQVCFVLQSLCAKTPPAQVRAAIKDIAVKRVHEIRLITSCKVWNWNTSHRLQCAVCMPWCIERCISCSKNSRTTGVSAAKSKE